MLLKIQLLADGTSERDTILLYFDLFPKYVASTDAFTETEQSLFVWPVFFCINSIEFNMTSTTSNVFITLNVVVRISFLAFSLKEHNCNLH